MNALETALAGADAALRGLKDFQLQTVDYVFDRLYGSGATGRFLVADEVGLGKTMVARGVVARAVQHLKDKVDRVDVVYICSNGDIARQNVDRLRVEGNQVALTSRLTLLPREAKVLRENPSRVNFISFTPGTTFDVGSGLGRIDERVLLYALIRDLWDLKNRSPPLYVFAGNAGSDRFRNEAIGIDVRDLDQTTVEAFAKQIQQARTEAAALGQTDLRDEFDELCDAYPTYKSSPAPEISRRRSQFIGKLRSLLARSCVESLQPDLVILDEFQRFSHLLDGDDDASMLAREIFNYDDARVLMLSATPYKMYTAAHEADGEDHYRDFVRTVRFLERNESDDKGLEALLEEYRKSLLDVDAPTGLERVGAARDALEARLRKVMVRTERLASTPDRNGMLTEVRSTTPAPTSDDVLSYVGLTELARRLEHHEPMEYWKSAPYVLNFMPADGYKLKRELNAALENGAERMSLAPLIRRSESSLLSWDRIERFQDIDPGNPRMRTIVDDTVGRGAHRLLWTPPSLAYYAPEGPFADERLKGFTKRLIFSSWQFVPRAIAAIVSYEAERQMVEKSRAGGYGPESRKRRAGLLRFGRDSEKRLTGMPVLALMYPSVYLARSCDPVALAAERLRESSDAGGYASLANLLSDASERISVALERVKTDRTEGPVDERWYWAAPLMLDARLEPDATRRWFEQKDLAEKWSGEDASSDDANDHWRAHVEEARKVAVGEGEQLGRMPSDLAQVLAELALGGPGVTMLRAMLRVVRMNADVLKTEAGVKIRDSAAAAAWNFRSLFNQAEVADMLRATSDQPDLAYWRVALRYGAAGCLQAVLDEYAHVLRDHLGLLTGTESDKVHKIAEQIAEALSLRTASLAVDEIAVSDSGRTVRTEDRRMRCHFALRFGDEKADDGSVATRADSVRKAFNSPFWPFVLATTSVGQEGLDFHTYCHAVVHWNLPSNPVDLEQREGRVHRYKNHAVRKNVAREFGGQALADEVLEPWETIFERARKARPADATDLVPYWVYCPENGAKIERHVAAMPLSRERERMLRLSKALAVYRMVFGQPRQDDLLRHLASTAEAGRVDEISKVARIDLAPPSPAGLAH